MTQGCGETQVRADTQCDIGTQFKTHREHETRVATDTQGRIGTQLHKLKGSSKTWAALKHGQL
jgi:hypothetical protein